MHVRVKQMQKGSSWLEEEEEERATRVSCSTLSKRSPLTSCPAVYSSILVVSKNN